MLYLFAKIHGSCILLMQIGKHSFQIKAVRLLIEKGADVNFQCPPRVDRKRALHFGAASGNVEVSLHISKFSCLYNLEFNEFYYSNCLPNLNPLRGIEFTPFSSMTYEDTCHHTTEDCVLCLLFNLIFYFICPGKLNQKYIDC